MVRSRHAMLNVHFLKDLFEQFRREVGTLIRLNKTWQSIPGEEFNESFDDLVCGDTPKWDRFRKCG